MGDWSSAQYIVSQIFISAAYILLALTYFVTKRWKQLAITISSNVVMATGFILLGGWVAVSMCAIAICRDVTSSILNERRTTHQKMKNTKADWWFLALWLSALTIATVLTQEGFMTLFAFFATVTFTISIWQKNPLIYRIMGVFVGIFWIIYNVVISNAMGVVLESALLTSVVIGLIMFCRSLWIKKSKSTESRSTIK